jgi:hypothetical protein
MTGWRLAAGAALLLGCAGRDVQRPSLDGPYACGLGLCLAVGGCEVDYGCI